MTVWQVPFLRAYLRVFVELDLPMPVRRVISHLNIVTNKGKVALQRGPIVYCLESTDLPQDVKISEVALSPETKFKSHFDKNLLGGITALQASAQFLAGKDWGDSLYRTLTPQEGNAVTIRMIPYYAWDNRDNSEMTVWIPLR